MSNSNNLQLHLDCHLGIVTIWRIQLFLFSNLARFRVVMVVNFRILLSLFVAVAVFGELW